MLTFVTDDLRIAYDGLVEIVGLASIGYVSVFRQVVGNHPDAAEILAEFGTALSQRWFDQESGRYQRPEPGSDPDDAPRRYHGYR